VIWAVLALLAVVALTPLVLTLVRGAAARGRRDSAMALHRAQLVELDRDLADGRIAPAEHATAVLEVQRRLLADAAAEDATPTRASRVPLFAVLVIVPFAAIGLYLIDGTPDVPSVPFAERQAEEAQDNMMIAHLREKLAQMDQTSDQTRQGYLILGNAEESRGNWSEAAAAFSKALAIRFDPTLAARTAESLSRSSGKVTPEAAQLFRQALAAAPQDAPWRGFAEDRIKSAQP
jgi:cytochrome c-type biogenesis protein CcmH